MAYSDIEKRRTNDLARFHRRNEARRAAGLCLKCGKTEPAPECTLCEPCLKKRRAADRAAPPGSGPRASRGAIQNGRSAMSASAAAGSTPSGRPPASAPSAAGLRRAPSARPASPAPSSTAPATAPVTPRRRPRDTVWRTRSRGPAPRRPEAQPPAQRGPPGRRSVHPLRPCPARGWTGDVRTVPRRPAGREDARAMLSTAAQKCPTGSVAACPGSPREGPARGGDAPSARLAAARAWEGPVAHGVKRGVIRTVAGVVTGSA